MDIVDELEAEELPGDRQRDREARILLGGLLSRAANEIKRLRHYLNNNNESETSKEFTGAYRRDFSKLSVVELVDAIRGLQPHELDGKEYAGHKVKALTLIQVELGKRDPDEVAQALIQEVING